MPINRTGSCQEVCRIVRLKLEKSGALRVQDVKHGPLFDALDQVTIVPTADIQQVRAALEFNGDPVEHWSMCIAALEKIKNL